MIAALTAQLAAMRVALGIPGVSATIRFPDGTAWTGAAGLADVASRSPVTVRTPFPIASISKTFLAALILQLVGAGRLGLDEGVAKLLPGINLNGRPIDPAITVRMLLDHSSGLRDYLVDARVSRLLLAQPTHVWTVAEALGYVGKPYFPPGAGFHYSNTNYLLLGLIVERLTGHSVAVELRRRFFGPLGLHATTFQGAEPSISPVARAYRFTTNDPGATPILVGDSTAIRPFTAVITAAGPAGAIASSSADVARWAEALYAGRIVPLAVVRAMAADASRGSASPSLPYGLGVEVLMVDRRLTYGHGGRLLGSQGVVRYFPLDGLTIAVLTNQSRVDPALVVEALLGIADPFESLPPAHVAAR